MPTKEDRYKFTEAIQSKDSWKIRQLLQRDDAKELLLMKRYWQGCQHGYSPLHDACATNLDSASFQLILDIAVEHGIIKDMLEAMSHRGTCLGLACNNNLHIDSLRLLFEHVSKYADIKEILENKQYLNRNCVTLACDGNLSPDSFRLLLEYSLKHTDIKKVLEEKGNSDGTCLHSACLNHIDSLHLLLEYLSKYADIRTLLEPRTDNGFTVLHEGCSKGTTFTIRDSPADSMRLVISFFPTKELFTHVLAAKCRWGKTPVEYADSRKYKVKKMLQDPDCFEKCRLWLLRNHEKTFLYSLFPNSFDKTCQALKELTKNGLQYSQQLSTIMLVALMSSPAKFREAIDKTDSSAPMSSYLDVVKKGDTKSDYNHWRKNIHLFRDFYGQWPSSERKTAISYEGEGSCCACVIQ